MGKRSDFERVSKDYYRTFDPKAVKVLINFMEEQGVTPLSFIEPCAGDGVLTDQLIANGIECLGEYDIEPKHPRITQFDALKLQSHHLNGAEEIITNSPWGRKLLHPMIERFANLAPTWLLFDSDWAFTKQSRELLNKYCTDIVVVGRLKWIEGSKMSGKDNCAWYRFEEEVSYKRDIKFHNLLQDK